MAIKLIALDLDGTTLDRQSKISKRTREAIIGATKKGIHVVIATGRCFDALPNEIVQMGNIQYVITSNGAQIHDLHRSELIYSNCIHEDAMDQIGKLLGDSPHMVEVFVDGRAYIEKRHYDDVVEGRINHRSLEYVRLTRRPTHGLIDFMLKNKGKVENINIFFDTLEDKKNMWKSLQKLKNVSLTSSFDNNWEIGGSTTSKGCAIKELCERLNVQREQVMACGDSPNDEDMLRLVGLPVAVDNAKDLIKKISKVVVPSNEEDGVAVAIETYALREL